MGQRARIQDERERNTIVAPSDLEGAHDNERLGRKGEVNRLILPLIVTGIVIVAILLTATKERPTMNASTTGRAATSLPPIDQDAPEETATATFAMG